MAVTIQAGRWAHFSKGGRKTKGRERKGYQAANLLAAMTVESQKAAQQPRVERARVAVDSMRIFGPDDLTARDEALYQFLLSRSREEGFDRETHRIEVSRIRAYLDVRDEDGRGRKPAVDRVVESLDRLARTWVRYSFLEEVDGGRRRRATLPLILAETVERLQDGTAVVEWSIPFALRRMMLEATDYVMLDINVFPRFRCRYSSRLYQRLAVIARSKAAVRKPWEIAPQELAEQLGWQSKSAFHCGAFMRDCLQPAVDEINRYVHGFQVKLTKVPGKGRGSPVAVVKIEVAEKRIRHRMEYKSAPLTFAEVTALKEGPEGSDPNERPSPSMVARAVTMTGLRPHRLAAGWHDALRTARRDPSLLVGAQFEGAVLLHILKREGADRAFWEWACTKAEEYDRPVPVPVQSLPLPDNAMVIEEREGYRQTLYPAYPKPQPLPTMEQLRELEAKAAAMRAARAAEAAPRPSAPPAPPAQKPVAELDPFDDGVRVLELSDDIPF